MANIMFIDLETNGLPLKKSNYGFYEPYDYSNYDTCRIIEIAYIIACPDGNVIKKYSNLIIPYDFDILNTDIHGITMLDAVNNGVELYDVFNELLNDLDSVNTIIAHNIYFDENILLSECYRAKRMDLIQKICQKNKICTMNMGKKYMEQKKNPKLVELYKHLFNKDVVGNHRALVDTEVCMESYFKMVL
jgi:DNA polymerase III epsilon subunit-like protein